MSRPGFFVRHRHKIVPTCLLLGLVGFSLVFRGPILAWFTGQALGSNHATATITRAGSLQLRVQLQPDPPRQRGNVLSIEVQDAQGAPVEQAEVQASYVMPAMGAMPEMRGEAEVTTEGGGRYRAAFDLPMGGTWTLEVQVSAASGTATARYTFTVGTPGLRQVSSTASPAGQHATLEADGIQVDAQRRQRIGVRTGRATKQPLHLTIRAVGRVNYDESRLTDVTLKLRGWITRLHVNTTGQYVRRGQVLFSFYSPELYAAQQEYLLARRSQEAARHTGAPERADYLVRAARQRLHLLDITEAQLGDIERRGEPLEHMPILAPASGYVIEKHVVAGAGVEPGQRLYRLAALDRVWVEAEVYESDLLAVKVGQAAQIRLPYVPGKQYTGRITYVYPYLQESTRTGRVRIELHNPALELRPDMYANVEVRVPLGTPLLVPEEAVVHTGRHRLVFVDIGEGYLRPQAIETGRKGDGYYEVLAGLREGDLVVTSGNFLVASESRIRSAVEQWGGADARP